MTGKKPRLGRGFLKRVKIFGTPSVQHMLFHIAIENDSGRVDLPIKLVIFHSQVHLLKGKPILHAQFEQEFTLIFGQHFKAITNFWS